LPASFPVKIVRRNVSYHYHI